ncbi:MAG TPA: glutaminyl-peptide cyclotransferase [Bacteroidales bacterium]|nr:glutaminyl-peptide cyclotransferase [Bacteroidales bacterium]
MRTDYPRFFISITLILALTWMFSCSGKPGNKEEKKTDKANENTVAETRISLDIIAPADDEGFKLNEPVRIILETDAQSTDSIVIFYDSRRLAALTSGPWEYTIPEGYLTVTGKKALKATTYHENKSGSFVRFIRVLSDKAPEKYGYRIVHTYPHDKEAFTQGLFYHNGLLYEGTGQMSGSSLREVELETSRVIRQRDLDASLFGEGITLYKDKIFQVTWENKVGFVYDIKSFEVHNTISYPMQGWGLTTVDDRIVLSDGSNILYFFEPEMFTVISRLEVYDDKGAIDMLNELEYINGEIWANVWMKDIIVRIDPKTGKVNSVVDLSGLLKAKDKTPETDVLNGIAWDKEGGRIFVTGKLWPKLFEISISK